MSNRKIHLVIIDGQNDFCDPKGALPVAGADKDMERLAKMIRKNKKSIDDIQATLDSHQLVHIAHPICWRDKAGNNPKIYTMIKLSDVEGKNPAWYAANPSWQTRQVDYVRRLETNGRYPLVIWPPHCLIGTWGHGLYPALSDALLDYQAEFADVRFVTKGSNPFTEHYSAIQADVPDPADAGTAINTEFINRLQEADDILISGEAKSHCVANTLRDVINNFGKDNAKKFVLLVDAMSNVTTFEKLGDDFEAEMKALGVRISTTVDFFKA